MEKRKLSGKTILKLVGALLALTYLGFYFYVGITGKLPYMHETVHIMRYGERKKWVAGGMTAAMILGICINSALNDLNLKRIRKESFLPLFFTMIFPIILLLLLEAFLDNGWLGIGIYASVAIFMCATAWIPLILRKWITHLLLRDKPMSGKQQVQIIEWIHFHPLKKLLIFGLWGFGVVLVLRGIWVTAIGKIEMDGELFLFLLGTAVLVVALFQKMRRYICAPYRNIPVLNQILSKKQLEQLLDGEHFEPIEFEDEGMKLHSASCLPKGGSRFAPFLGVRFHNKKYLEIYRSQNWMLIGGKLLSKKLALWVTMNRSGNDASLKVLYLNGMTAKAKVNLDIRGDRYKEFTVVLKELIGYEGTLKLDEKEEQLAQKFASFFPEQTSEQDRVAAFLSQDVTEIRQDYIQTFSPPPDPRKKKRSRRERE